MFARFELIGILIVMTAAIGCSRGPARIDAPEIDPEAAAAAAMELYDADRNGLLDATELARCPAILARLTAYDQNGDKLVDEEEISRRLDELFGQHVGLTQLRSRVIFRGQPLTDAKVVFEPEAYLGEEIQVAEGKTNRNGSAQMSIAEDGLPENVRDRELLQYGSYKVRITHPTIKLPPKYNTETTLGYETVIGDPFATFSLKP